MPQPFRYELERQLQPTINLPVDAPRFVKMPEGVQPGIFRPQYRAPVFVAFGVAILIENSDRHPGGNLGREKASVEDVLVALDVSDPVRKYEAELSFRTQQTPLPQGFYDYRRQRNCALARVGFWLADIVIAVGSLPDVEFAVFQINACPRQAAQFGRAETRKDQRHDERHPTANELVNNRLDLSRGRDMHADLELAPLATV